MIWYIYAWDLPLRPRGQELAYLWPEPELITTIVRKSLSMGLQIMVVSTSALTVIGMVNRQGLTTTAAYGVASQLWIYIPLPAMAIGAAVSAMAAQNIGANNWDRIGQIARCGLIFKVVLTGALVALVALADHAVIAVFLPPDSMAVPIAAHINLIVSWGFILFGAAMTLFGVVRATGAVVAPLAILAVAMLPVRLGFAYALQPWLGAEAVWWSFPLGSAASLIMATIYYLRGTWRAARSETPVHHVEVRHTSGVPSDLSGARLCAPT